MLKNTTLIVFAKNPILGKAKTRIAKQVGDVKALEIYEHLLTDVRHLCEKIDLHVACYYSAFIDPNDAWTMSIDRHLQLQHPNLGDRMLAALQNELVHSQKVIIIGSDCPYITPNHIESVSQALDRVDTVIGPSTDGGFYLLGLRKIDDDIFDNIQWSSELVCQQLKMNLNQRAWTFSELEPLTDIDEYEDWLAYKRDQ